MKNIPLIAYKERFNIVRFSSICRSEVGPEPDAFHIIIIVAECNNPQELQLDPFHQQER